MKKSIGYLDIRKKKNRPVTAKRSFFYSTPSFQSLKISFYAEFSKKTNK